MSSRTAAEAQLTPARIRVICAARILLFATFMTVAACIPVLVDAWRLSAAAAGAIVSSFTVGYALSLFGFGWAADHLGARRMTELSAVAAAVTSALFGLLADGWWSAMLLYGLVGLAQGGVYTPLIMVFSDDAPPERRGNAMGWLIASTSVGYATSLGVAAIGIALGGWQVAFIVSGLLPALGAAVLLAALRGLPNRIHERPPRARLAEEVVGNRGARLLIGGYVAHNWELLGMWAWLPAFLATGFALSGGALTGATVAGAWLGGGLHLFGATAAFSMGHLSDRTGRRPVLVTLALAGTVLSCAIGWLVQAPAAVLIPLALAYAFVCLGDSPVLTTALAEQVRPGYLGATLAWRSLAGFGAGAAAPVAFGAVLDMVRSVHAAPALAWGSSFVVLGIGGAIASLCAVRLPRPR
ncbi:MFS transporter [Spiribacter halobius]|uniref:MFS transporter n=1 Tax=Sediminicurvatus halobius TaxID=2182432 RepID=A0A2U2N5Q5_9GAMM|nr:MFS transporter [Spiribacter halobius]PWG64378.1 MFS transporter [Spiribacter halobius]UEX79274.1 MFS transporter [Spiribacter halobius]